MATAFEFRFRLAISTVIYVLGFWAPWLRFGSAAEQDPPRLWSWLAIETARTRLLTTGHAYIAITALAIACALLGACFRVFGTVYLGRGVVFDKAMQAGEVVAAGPYRHVRNPLYLGSLITAVAVSILMPVSGAVFFLIAICLFVVRLTGGEEAFLRGKIGDAYAAYCRAVPRWIPSIAPKVPASTTQPQFLQSLAAEFFPVAFALCLLFLAWNYDVALLIRCVLVCFGISLVLRAFRPGISA